MPDAQPHDQAHDQAHDQPSAGPHDQPDTGVPPDRAGGELHLAVALDGAGWHPAAWREPDARPHDLFTAGYWADLAVEAERGLLDFITIEDSLGIQSANRFGGVDDRADQVRGRLDAVLIAARIAPLTSHVGIVPTGTMTHTEPFHLSTALATLDYVSGGRAGWRAQLSPQPEQARHFGHRELPSLPASSFTDPEAQAAITERFDEGADFIEVVRRLWDSWEDDAVIRDAATGRFIDRDKLHYIDFEGRWFSVRGPSITPRPPQGQLPVVVLAHAQVPYELAARSADIAFITPARADHAEQVIAQVRAAAGGAGREMAPSARAMSPSGTVPSARTAPSAGTVPSAGTGDTGGLGPLRVYADLTVFLDDSDSAAIARKQRLDRADGADYRSDTAIFTGTAGQLADLLLDWRRTGLAGFRLRPGALPHDLEQITRKLVPALQARGAFRAAYAAGTLRERLGLAPWPANRYAEAGAAT
jgi:alkanesulfonate monooxygenase SsuD/methylene tetrahydromethanopterin reductase-like flavin-dependent oxidoreductase (luciferase family)